MLVSGELHIFNQKHTVCILAKLKFLLKTYFLDFDMKRDYTYIPKRR